MENTPLASARGALKDIDPNVITLLIPKICEESNELCPIAWAGWTIRLRRAFFHSLFHSLFLEPASARAEKVQAKVSFPQTAGLRRREVPGGAPGCVEGRIPAFGRGRGPRRTPPKSASFPQVDRNTFAGEDSAPLPEPVGGSLQALTEG